RRTDVETVEREPAAPIGTRAGEVREVPGRQVVDHVDLVTLGEQPVDERRPDEPCPSGDERPHRSLPISGSVRAGRVRAASDTSWADRRALTLPRFSRRT